MHYMHYLSYIQKFVSNITAVEEIDSIIFDLSKAKVQSLAAY